MNRPDVNAQPLRNIVRDPKLLLPFNTGPVRDSRWFGPSGSAGTYAKITGATDGPPGGLTDYFRKTWTAIITGNVADTGFDGTIAGGSSPTRIPVRPGDTVSYGYWIRTSASGKLFGVSFYALAADGLTATGARLASQPVVILPNAWTFVVGTVTIPANRTDVYYVRPAFDPSFAGGSTPWVVGDSLDITGIVGSPGPWSDGYCDGDTPGWRWTGTAGASESVGYPYMLESIAGPPLATLSTPGTSSAPLGLTAFEGRTLYAVGDVVDMLSNLPAFAAIGSAATSGPGNMTLRGGATGNSNLEQRTQSTDQQAAAFASRSAARNPGRHVMSGTANQGLTSIGFAVGSATATGVIAPGTGHQVGTLNRLHMGAGSASDTPIFAAAYRGEHNLETRFRIQAWLARKYGGVIPAGY